MQAAIASIGGSFKEGIDYERVIDGMKSTEELPYNQIRISAKPNFPSLTSRLCIIIPIVSQTHIRIYSSFATTKIEGWDTERIDIMDGWKNYDIPLGDKKFILEQAKKILTAFTDFSIVPIKEYYDFEIDSDKKTND